MLRDQEDDYAFPTIVHATPGPGPAVPIMISPQKLCLLPTSDYQTPVCAGHAGLLREVSHRP